MNEGAQFALPKLWSMTRPYSMRAKAVGSWPSA